MPMLKWSFVEHGPHAGTPAFFLRAPNLSEDLLVEYLQKIEEYSKSLHTNVVVIENIAVEHEGPIFMQLLQVLRDKNFYVIGLVYGNNKPSWTGLVSWLAVYITEKPWLNFNANEIVFVPTKTPFAEPIIHENNKMSLKYIAVPSKFDNSTDLINFFMESEHKWAKARGASIEISLLGD